MFEYVVIYAIYYLTILMVLAPWVLLFIGSTRAIRRQGGRLRRMQLEGAILILAGTISKWTVFDTLFGLDRLNSETWSYWFSRGETGWFLIGLLLFGLGFFLERRPRPGLTPWPKTVKSTGLAGILVGIGLAMVAYRWFQYPWLHLPWSVARVIFSLGMFPFAIGYVILGRRLPEPPVEP